MLNTNQKIEHLKKLGLNGDFEQIERMYNGEKFDVRDEEYRRLLQLSKEYCMRFTQLSELISRAKSAEEIEKYNKEKSEILDNLFPGHGVIYGCGDGLFAIIGTVDLEGFNYINARVHFNASALTHLDEYVFVASNVEFGDNNICTQDGQTQLSRINVGRDTWIGANVNFDNYTEVGEKSVIGMGSHITSNSQLKPSMISFGNPCREYKFITEDYETKVKKPGAEGIRSNAEVEHILEHMKKLGVKGDFTQYIRALTYEKYNTLEPTISKIYELSHKLCSEYNSQGVSIRRRKEILDALFPLQGSNLVMGDDIFVDCIGTVKIGNDVSVGDHTTLAGNITIGDRAKLGRRVVLQTTGHEVNYKGRKITADSKGNVCEISTPGFIIVRPEIILADGTKVIPDQTVKRNTRKDEIVTHSRDDQSI